MASPTATTAMGTKLGHLPRLRDIIDHDYEEDDDFVEEEEEELEEWDMSKRMSRLSVEGSDGGDADDEDDGYRSGGGEEEEEEDGEEVRSDVNGECLVSGGGGGQWQTYGNDQRSPQLAPSSASLPGTPDRWATAQSPWWCSKDYASETEAAQWPCGGGGGGDKRRMRHRRERMMREVWLDRAWQMRKQRRQPLPQGQGSGVDAVTVVAGAGGGGGESPTRGGVSMDMEEMRACRDLGLDLPCDWTVEIPCYALSGVDTASSGGNSPASGSWRISSPGDDPNDVKARLKVWAQAVALASASRLGSESLMRR